MSNTQTSINNSVSKAQFSFSKASRFPVHNSLNQNVAYDLQKTFGKGGTDGGGGRPFLHTSQRFSYYNSPGKGVKHPSPNTY